jgi:hypothetical protein
MRVSRAAEQGDLHVRMKAHAGPPRFEINVTTGMMEFRGVEIHAVRLKRLSGNSVPTLAVPARQ